MAKMPMMSCAHEKVCLATSHAGGRAKAFASDPGGLVVAEGEGAELPGVAVKGKTTMDYLGTGDIAQRWEISERQVRLLCEEGEVAGAKKVGGVWQIPINVSQSIKDSPLQRETRYPELLGLFARLEELRQSLETTQSLSSAEEERLWEGFVIENTYDSNAIEGNTLTLRETSLVLKGLTIEQHPLREHLEVTGHAEALDFIKDLASRREPITSRVIREIHSLVLADKPKDRGTYRGIPVRIVGSPVQTASPADIPLRVDALLKLWCQSPYHSVEAAAEFHLGFEAIHPFIDGNGRTGRLLLNLMLTRAGYLPINVKYADRRRYYDAFVSYDESASTKAMAELVANYELSSIQERLTLRHD